MHALGEGIDRYSAHGFQEAAVQWTVKELTHGQGRKAVQR